MENGSLDILLEEREQMTKILAIIPARGGSKGLPRKNILDIQGKPLVAWTVEASLKSKYITDTYVSSDDNEILEVSQKYGANILKRAKELATDTASSESVVEDVIEILEKKGEKFDYLVLLQPTSPLRDEKDIDEAFKILFEKKATALISVVKYDNKILKAFIDNQEGFIEGIRNNKYPFTRRQDLPKVYMSNGAIYIIKVDEFMKNRSFWTQKSVKFVMDEIKSMDIDTKEDLEKVKGYMR